MSEVIKIHAARGPSGASGWMWCVGWKGGSGSNEHSREGTAAHELAERCLQAEKNAADFLGEVISVEGQDFTVDADMAEPVQQYVDLVRQVRDGSGGDLLVEQRLPIDHITREEGACGTSDAVVLTETELIVIDLKFGRGVQVDAERNEQLQLYALGALRQFGVAYDFKRVRMIISQPRLRHVSEWDCSVDELMAFAGLATEAACRDENGERTPGEKQCRWCTNKPCAALDAHVEEVIGADFDALPDAGKPTVADSALNLAVQMEAIGLVEDWCKAVRAETERRLLAGKEVPGFKLVLGKQGNRKWADEAQAEQMLKTFRLKQEEMYDFTVISPTAAEKLAKAETIGKRQWPKLQTLITRSEPKPSVAPVSDKRDAYVPPNAADDFAPVPESQPQEAAGLDLC